MKYKKWVRLSDTLLIAFSLLTAYLIRFGLNTANFVVEIAPNTLQVSYPIICIIFGTTWIFSVYLSGSWERRILGTGVSEYQRLVSATFVSFTILGLAMYTINASFSRQIVFSSMLFGLISLISSRWMWRQWLVKNYRRGLQQEKLLVIGYPNEISTFISQSKRHPTAGFNVVGACTIGVDSTFQLDKRFSVLPNSKILTSSFVISEMKKYEAESILFFDIKNNDSELLEELSWSLDPNVNRVYLSVSGLDIFGPRLHSRQLNSFDLFEAEVPSFSLFSLTMKRIFDFCIAVLATLLISPLLIIIGLAIRINSPGPIIFRQERVGLNGKKFTMYKFRSMKEGSHLLHEQLAAAQQEKTGNILFKLNSDPRVTPLGAFLRKWSLDELPQLLNVIRGDMSLVGPRPPLASEVEHYDKRVHRKFLVRPGLTGLWQVSGRSNLNWEESVRLDLLYVQDWSLILDAFILLKTFRIIFTKQGAY